MNYTFHKYKKNLNTIITKLAGSIFVSLNTLFVFGFYALANDEVYIDFNFDENSEIIENNESLNDENPVFIDEVAIPKNNISLPYGHIYESTYDLKEIPKYNPLKVQNDFKKSKNNPFLIEAKSQEANTSYFLSNLKVTGIITINNKVLTIVSSIYGTDSFEMGDMIGDGYLIKNINTNPASVLISNNKYSRLFILEEK